VLAATAGQWTARATGLVLQAAHFALVARALGTGEFAGWVAALALLMIAGALAEFGLTDTIVVAAGVPGTRTADLLAGARRASTTLLGASLAVALVGSVVLTADGRLATLVLLPWFLAARRTVVWVAHRRSQLDFVRLGVAEVAGRAAAVVLVAPVAAWGSAWSPTTQLLAAAASLAGGSVVSLAVLHERGLGRTTAAPGPTAKGLLVAAVPLGLATAASFVHFKSDQLVLGVVAGAGTVPAYAVAARVFDAVYALAHSGAVVGFSHLVRADGAERGRAAARHQALVILAALALGAATYVAAPAFVAALAGGRYPGAVRLTRLLCPAMVAGIVNVATAQVVIAAGRTRALLAIATVCALGNVVAATAFASAWGATGAAVATTCTMTAEMAATAWAARRSTAALLPPVVVVATVAAFAVATSGAVWLATHVHPGVAAPVAVAALAIAVAGPLRALRAAVPAGRSPSAG
jgi:O-antigen/teichoic acid export membrane protein